MISVFITFDTDTYSACMMSRRLKKLRTNHVAFLPQDDWFWSAHSVLARNNWVHVVVHSITVLVFRTSIGSCVKV